MTQKQKPTLLARILMVLLRPFLHMKVMGVEKIQEGEPAAFICNHCAIFGPISAVMYLPIKFRPWINNAMLDKESAKITMSKTYEGKCKFLGRRIKKAFLSWLAGLVAKTLNSFDPIPVIRGVDKRMHNTFDDSVQTLKSGVNLLIFPEKPELRYDKNSYTHLYVGFSKFASLYYKETGKCLKFYPVFTNQKKHTISIAEPVCYNPNNEEREERFRIANEIVSALKSMA